jgi:cholesterol transport system auxiliary component
MSHRLLSALALSLLIAACATPSGVRAPAVHDFGPDVLASLASPAVPLRRVEVTGPAWLATTAMQYRLLGRTETERRSYADNRWAAQPVQLLEQRLQRRLPARSDSRCKLQVKLDELIQEFAVDGTSRVRLTGIARLVGERGEDLVDGLSFDYRQTAQSVDAAGGVRASAAASERLALAVQTWLGSARPGLCDPG